MMEIDGLVGVVIAMVWEVGSISPGSITARFFKRGSRRWVKARPGRSCGSERRLHRQTLEPYKEADFRA